MKSYPFPDNRGWKAAFSLFLLAMLLLARDSMFTTAVIGFYKAQFCMLGLIAVLAVAFLLHNRHAWRQLLTDRRLLMMAAAAAVFLVPMAVKGDWQLMYFSVLLGVLLGIFLSWFSRVEQTAKVYVCLMTALGAYSVLATYLLRIAPDNGWFAVPVFRNAKDFEFHNFFLAVVSDSYVKNRNFGIFREPGVYQFFLILALYLNNDRVRWEKPWQLWTGNVVLAVTMVTTFATGGFAEMALLAVLLFFDQKWYRSKPLRVAVAVLAGVVAVAAAYCIARRNALYWEVYDMLIGKFIWGTDSAPERMASILLNGQAFLGSPLVGQPLAEVLHALQNNTSSTMILLAGFGVLAGALHLASWLALVWKKERCWAVNFCYFGILLLSFNTQNLIADVFLWMIPMMALTEAMEPRLAGKKGGSHGS